MPYPRLFGTTLLALAVTHAAVGQNGRGTLTGSVLDLQGGVLQGARVTLDPSGATMTSDPTGQFAFTGLAVGDYTLKIDYSGFSPFVQKVTIASGQSIRIAASMVVAANTLDVQVYADRQGGELEAINRTFNADNIINVLPADVITSLPNANIADALGRLPSVTLERDEGEGKYVQIRGTEPRLTNTTIDGVNVAAPEAGVRQVKLDLIPADLVESVQINKTLEANMPADGIGGSVDLRTRSASDQTTVALEGGGGYTPIIGGRGVSQFDGTIGKRFLDGKKLGAIFSGSYDWNGRGINDVEPGPAVVGLGEDLRDYRYYRERLGFAGTADYRISDVSSVALKGLYSHFNNFGDRWVYSPQINTLVSQYQGDTDGSIAFNASIRRPVQDVGNLQLSGHTLLKNTLLTGDIDASVGRTRDSDYAQASFRPYSKDASNPLNNIQYGLDVTDPLKPKFNVQNGINIYDLTHEFLYKGYDEYTYSPEVDLGFGASAATSYTVAGHSGTFEFGGRFRNAHKFQNTNERDYVPLSSNPEDATLAASNFQGSFTDPGYYNGDYKFGPTVDYSKFRQAQASITVFDATSSFENSAPNNFDLNEKISAGYVMNTINFGKFRLVTGLRIEGTNENNLGYIFNSDDDSIAPVRGSGSYVDYLPSASVRYALDAQSGVRLVYGRGLSRPNFQDLVPYRQLTDKDMQISVGNPNLKAEHANNLDLLYERALSHQGLLQAGVYYKNLTDPIVPVQTIVPATAATYAGYQQIQSINAGSAYVYGFEIAFQQHFTYLPGLASGLGLSANYGYSASQLTFPPATNPDGSDSGIGRTDKPDLIRQAPHTWNISPTYDKKRLSVRLGLSYNDANIFQYNYNDGNAGPFHYQDGSGGGIKGPNGDIYLYSHIQTDLQGSYKLGKGFTAVAYGLNLNNEVFGFYQGSTIYPIQREYYKPTFGGSIRWSPREK